jgi:SAM-dependent methyltransferase
MRMCGACRAALAGPDWRCAACQWQAPVRDGVSYLLDGTQPAPEAFTETQAHGLASIDPEHFWFASRNKLIVWAMTQHARHAQTMLEVGCGAGHVLRALANASPGLRLTGAEVSPEGLRLTSRLAPGAELVCADTRHLPYQEEFDVVGAFDVLEHIPEHAQALGAIARAARRDGVVILTVPQHPALWSPLDDYSGHQRRYTRRELIALAEDAGLEVVRVTSFVSLLLPCLWLSRLAQRYVHVTPGREFTITSRIRGIAMAVMHVEVAAIKAGLSLPAGGSLLLVARRR